jgi:segregation and condensation protein B
MSLKAKIEAVIYAAEEPVALAQLAAVFADELPPIPAPEPATDSDQPTAESLIERGYLYAATEGTEDELEQLVVLQAQRDKEAAENQAPPDPASQANAEAYAKRLARQRDRDLRERLKAIVDELIHEYASGDRGMEIREVAGGYRIATKPEYHDAVRSFVKSLKPAMKLSLQALETLAVIAYKQPVTAPEVSEIRGVESGGVLGTLVSRKLITTAGRKQVIGRPILYKTTREFLLRFGLKDLNELPSIEEFEKLASDVEIEVDNTLPEDPPLPFEPDDATDTVEDLPESTTPVAPSLPTVPSSERVGSTNSTVENSPATEPTQTAAAELGADPLAPSMAVPALPPRVEEAVAVAENANAESISETEAPHA